MPVDKAAALANGKIYTGREALDLGQLWTPWATATTPLEWLAKKNVRCRAAALAPPERGSWLPHAPRPGSA